jgi:hypothetical protein
MSAIEHIAGSTWHGRKGDLKNAFRYSIDYLCLDIENSPPKKGIFKLDCGWLFGLYGRDHGGPVGRGRGAAWVRDVAAFIAWVAKRPPEFLSRTPKRRR